MTVHQRARICVALAEQVRDRDGDERAEEGAADQADEIAHGQPGFRESISH